MLTIHPQRNGVAGIEDTLALMVALVNKRYLDPLIRTFAVKLTEHCPAMDKTCQQASILAGVKRHMRYVRDPVGVEALYDPLQVVQAIRNGVQPYGDCDDFSIVIAALLKSIGIPVRFRAVGFRGGPLSHVYVIGPKGEKLDGIRNDWNPAPGELLAETSWLEKPI